MLEKTATADKPFSPTKSQLNKVAAQTHGLTTEYRDTVDFLKRQMQCVGGKWRCYFKVLVVIEYLLFFGSERCVGWAMENLNSIRALELFSHADEKARFRGEKRSTPPKFFGSPVSSADVKETQCDMPQTRLYVRFPMRRDCNANERKGIIGCPEFRKCMPSSLYTRLPTRQYRLHPKGDPELRKDSKETHQNMTSFSRKGSSKSVFHPHIVHLIGLHHD